MAIVTSDTQTQVQDCWTVRQGGWSSTHWLPCLLLGQHSGICLREQLISGCAMSNLKEAETNGLQMRLLTLQESIQFITPGAAPGWKQMF